MNHLNQSMLEQWETEDLLAYRQSIATQMGNMAVYLSQVDWILEQRGER